MKVNEENSYSDGRIYLKMSPNLTIKIKSAIFHFQPHHRPTITYTGYSAYYVSLETSFYDNPSASIFPSFPMISLCALFYQLENTDKHGNHWSDKRQKRKWTTSQPQIKCTTVFTRRYVRSRVFSACLTTWLVVKTNWESAMRLQEKGRRVENKNRPSH